MKALIFFILFIIISCKYQYSNYQNFDPLLIKFLEIKEDDDPILIRIDECMDNPIFTATSKSVNPPNIIEGQDIKLGIVGTMSKEQKVKSLLVENFINSQAVTSYDVDFKFQLVPPGEYSFNYTIKLSNPSSGKYEYYIYLINSSDIKISCLKAYFEIK